MTTINVQFSDATETKIVSVFCCPQDLVAYPNQGQIDDADPRYQAFINPGSTLSGTQAAQVADIQSAYQSAVNAPVTFKNAAGVTSAYASGGSIALNGQTAKQNLADALSAGASGWTLGKWLDMNNMAQSFTYADLQGLAEAMESVETLDWQDLVAKIAAIQSATTIAAVQAIQF